MPFFFTPLFSKQAIEKKVKNLIKLKGYTHYLIENIYLELKPAYFFKYSALKDSKQLTGSLSIDAINNSFYDLNYPRQDDLTELKQEKENNKGIKVFKAEFSLDEAKNVLIHKLSSEFSIPKTEIHLFAGKKVFIPFYLVKVSLQEKKLNYYFNAFNGVLIKSPEISFNKKSLKELSHELEQELKKPINWLNYLLGFFSFFNKMSLFKKILIIVLILIIFFLLLFLK